MQWQNPNGSLTNGTILEDGAGNKTGIAANPLQIAGSFSATLSGFTPNGNYLASPQPVSVTSSNVALPSGTVIVVYNTGSSTAFTKLGTSGAVVATVADDVIPAGGWMAFTVGTNTYLAAITASGTASLNISGGSGLASGSGGSSSGGTVAATTIYANARVATLSASPLPSQALVNGVVLTAKSANAGTIYVGPAGVTTGTGYPLAPGQSISYTVANLSAI